MRDHIYIYIYISIAPGAEIAVIAIQHGSEEPLVMRAAVIAWCIPHKGAAVTYPIAAFPYYLMPESRRWIKEPDGRCVYFRESHSEYSAHEDYSCDNPDEAIRETIAMVREERESE